MTKFKIGDKVTIKASDENGNTIFPDMKIVGIPAGDNKTFYGLVLDSAEAEQAAHGGMNILQIEEEKILQRGTTEQLIQEKGLTAPRVTLDDVNDNIVGEFYFTGADALTGAIAIGGRAKTGHLVGTVDGDVMKLLTFCVLVLRNGFTVTGESACASPENFNAEIGRKIARQNAEQKIWPLMGYHLKQQLSEGIA